MIVPAPVQSCADPELRDHAIALINQGGTTAEINAAVMACLRFNKVVVATNDKAARRSKFQEVLHKSNAAETYDLFE